MWDEDRYDYDSDSNGYIAEKSESQRKRKETMDHFKYFSRRFDRVLRGEPKTERDINQDTARKVFALFSDRRLVVEDDLITVLPRNKDVATMWCDWLPSKAFDDTFFLESPARNRSLPQLFNVMFCHPLELWEMFDTEITHLMERNAEREAAKKKHRQKHRRRGKKGKQPMKDTAAATEPTTKTLITGVSHAESMIDSLGSTGLEDSNSSFTTGQVHSESILDSFLYASTTCSEKHTSETLDVCALLDGDVLGAPLSH